MFSEDGFIGCPRGIEDLRVLKDDLGDKVLEQVNNSQELVMLNSFSREASEYQIKKCLQQRISEISSWRWVLVDLSSRLDDGIAALKHEHNALRVIVQRLQSEINDHSREASRPGALKPARDLVEDAIMESGDTAVQTNTPSIRLDGGITALKHEHNALHGIVQKLQSEINDHSREASRPGALKPARDQVEDAIMEEYNFLRQEKKKFENMIPELDKQTAILEKTKKRIEIDLKCKQEALAVEESCSKIDINSLGDIKWRKHKKRSFSPLLRWENRCASLKRAGLNALSNSVITRQQVRGARVQLSIAAQSYGARVDAALRRRLHNNTTKLQELQWQREEAVKDLTVLDDELMATEQNVLETMDQTRLVQIRLADRKLRPSKETTRDDVDKTLREELARLKKSTRSLRKNIDKIMSLQDNLNATISHIDCCAEDLAQVVRLDQDRMAWRLGEQTKCDSGTMGAPPQRPKGPQPKPTAPGPNFGSSLITIKEEDEEDDYPFDD